MNQILTSIQQWPRATQIMVGMTLVAWIAWAIWQPFRPERPASLEKATPLKATELDRAAFTIYEIRRDMSSAAYVVDEEFLPESGLILGRNTNLGFNTAIGTTTAISGTFGINDLENPTDVSGQFQADLRQLTSIQPHRDGLLKRYWLESNQYPSARFEITTITEPIQINSEAENPTFQFDMTGNLTVRSITLPVTFETVATLEETTLFAEGTAMIKMSDFGISPPRIASAVIVEDDLSIDVTIVADQQ